MLVAAVLILFSYFKVQADTVLTPAFATAVKEDFPTAGPVSGVPAELLQRYGIHHSKDIGLLVPGLHLPDYGASLTSSIYVRGFGSRMENPVIGLYVDDFPILDKNSYDVDYLDIAGIRFLHGPQGTAYGRNALCGVLSIRTRRQAGLQARLEYGSGQTVRASVSGGVGQHSFSAAYRHTGGFFQNAYSGKMCDPYDGGQFRWRWEKPGPKWTLSHLLQAAFSDEGGFSYGAWKDGKVMPVNYNDASGYRRLTVLDGFKARLHNEKLTLDLMTSLQLLHDDMRMDQDYTPESIFTLQQRQLSGAQTFEAIARPARKTGNWRPVTGFFGFFKANHLQAPVLFKRDGIRKLILDNANAGIPDEIGVLDIPDTEFPVNSSFDILSWNAALYHESEFVWGRWHFTAGLRLDYEGAWMRYDCFSSLHYQMIPYMPAAKAYRDTYTGALRHGSFQLLPKLALQYDGPGRWLFFASLSKGYRAGGFNTQIFSDILQNRVMNGLMEDLGVYLDKPAVSALADRTEYQPEELWNSEAGFRYRSKSFQAQVSLFWAEAVNQQLTVFPPGMSTGRMMTNAGRSRSYGTEMQVLWHQNGFNAQASWGWNRARFLQFHDGQADYAGHRIPYSPEHTLFAAAGYEGARWALEIQLKGTGPIAWNEANSLIEPFYFTLGAQASLQFPRFRIYLQGENLTATRYRCFYFKSMGNEFFQLSKPVRITLGIQFSVL